MANLSKKRRDQMIGFLEELKQQHNDDASIRAFNEIENHLRDKKYGLVWEEHSEEVDELIQENIPILSADPERRVCKDKTRPWNFVIEGDNLQSLYLLEKTLSGKVDCIYIDPPYNNRNRSWKYNNDFVDTNDGYKHSKWLSLISNRLLLARRLLNPQDSVLIVTIDEKEYAHLGCLLEELFPSARIQMISTIIKPEGTNRANEFSRTNEFIFFVQIGNCQMSLGSSSMFEDGKAPASITTQTTPFNWRNLRRREKTSIRTARPNQFYPIFINTQTNCIEAIGDALPPEQDKATVPVPDNCFALYPMNPDGTEMLWGKHYLTARDMLQKGYLMVDVKRNRQKSIVRYLSEGTVEDIETGNAVVTGRGPQNEVIGHYNAKDVAIIPKTVWNVAAHNAQANGSLLLKKIIGENRFDYPKSVYAVYDTIKFFLASKPTAVVLDFFAGSGTTLHAVNLLNAEDNGQRTCIVATNNEMSEEDEKRLKARGLNPGDDEYEKYGVARYVLWPRTFCSIEGKNVFGRTLNGNYGAKKEVYIKDESEDSRGLYKKVKVEAYPELAKIKLSDGFNANVKYFKCGWTPRKPEDYLLSNVLCLHIKEMIELQNAIEIDNEKNVLLLNKSDVKRLILNEASYNTIEHVWVNQNIVLNAEELKLLEAKGFKYIPKEFFGQELKEAAE